MKVVKKKKINSKQKGSRGERDLRDFLKENGLTARRSQQFAGGTESSDVLVEEWNFTHIECKFTEHCKPYEFIEQAEKDSSKNKDLLPVVFFRKKNKKWIALMDAKELVSLLKVRENMFKKICQINNGILE